MFERFFGRALCESMNRMREKIGQIRCRVTPKYRHSMNVLHPKAAQTVPLFVHRDPGTAFCHRYSRSIRSQHWSVLTTYCLSEVVASGGPPGKFSDAPIPWWIAASWPLKASACGKPNHPRNKAIVTSRRLFTMRNR
ncbi:MAG: hypothetical protein RLZZ436_3622 [Planctomycetota bacterium]